MIMVRVAVPPGQTGRNGHTRARCHGGAPNDTYRAVIIVMTRRRLDPAQAA
jgi:hypothetical protein